MRVLRLLAFPLIAGVAPLAAQDQPAAPDGTQLFELVCAMCHSIDPPHKSAPPISHAAAFYLDRHPSPDSAVAAMVAYLREPAAERSALPPMAIERFGLMPSQAHLSNAQLEAVSRYVLTLADTAHVRGHRHGPP